MNREIKFRVWDKDSKKLLGYEFFNTSLNNGFFYIDLRELKNGENEGDLACHSEFHSPPMLKPKGFSQLYREQFTGLKDKNCKEIYEGDILSISIENEDGEEIIYKGIVKFGGNGKYVSDYPCSFIIHVKEWYKEEGLLGNRRHQYEVIGNIYENPELTK